jgi:CPA1 family monovalent cation:H+ antiporter
MHDGLALWVVGVVEVLLLASLSAVVLRRLRFPYTIGLVLVGLLLTAAPEHLRLVGPIRGVWLTPDVVLYLFLPTLLFPAAVHLDARLLRRNLLPVLLLAGPGLLVSTLVVGGVVAALTPLSWGTALLFGALISATDPVAVVALFKDLNVPGRLAVLVDGESLLNDAVAIVLFTTVLTGMQSGAVGPTAVARGAVDFVVVSVGGVLVGAVLAVVYARVAGLAEDDALVEIALSMVLAFTAFVVAHHYLHVSGIMAVVAAGLVGGALRRNRIGPETRASLRHFWSYAEFVANSFVFLVLGIGGGAFVHRLLGGDLRALRDIACAVGAALLGRLIAVYGLITVSNRLARAEPIDWRHQAIIFWGGGLRGALPLVMALSLPPAFEARPLILDLTAGVVLFTLLVQGTTVGRLIRACAPK